MAITPFTISVPDTDVSDLRDRIRRTRFPEVPANVDFSRGTSGEYVRELVGHWADFDWTAAQARLNELPQVLVDVADTRLHAIHARSTRPDAVPLLLVHGWPDSPFRYRRVVPLLTDPAPGQPAFHVVVPSLPGFGFSGHRAVSGSEASDLLAELMTELGYDRFVLGGGDLGTPVGLSMGRRHPERLHGLFLSNAEYPTGTETALTAAEQDYAGYIQRWWFSQGAYAMVQSTKPQIVGPGLADSPAGMAAFMLGLIDTGAAGHDVEAAFGGREELLTNFCLYWFTNTAASAADAYHAQAAASGWGAAPARVEVPTGFAIFPREAQSPREWCERQADVVRYTAMPRGGHFAALEVPDDYAAELQAFAAGLTT